jgi:trehalose 6-phosphate synthase
VQVATPSRERVEHYVHMRETIEQQVGHVNGVFGTLGGPAVHYINQSVPREELAALYRAADVMLVTPYRDGMNLVAKEYVAARSDLGGTLVLSEFAGAAAELKQAFLVNPHDIAGVKNQLVRALRIEPAEAARRMRAMRRHLARNDLEHWANSFFDALQAKA